MHNLTYSLSKDGNLSTWTLFIPLALVLLQSQPQHHSELCPILEILQLLFLLHRRGLVVRGGREGGREIIILERAVEPQGATWNHKGLQWL